jgi:hypothetical protein
VDQRARGDDQAERLSAPGVLQSEAARAPRSFASIPAVPDPKQEIAVGGPLLERLKRKGLLLLVLLVRLPYRMLTLPLRELRGEVASLRAAAVESLAYVGVELRRIGDLVEQGGAKAGPTPEETTLAGLDVRGPLLVVGRRGQKAGASLTSRGYDVTQVDALEGWDAGGRRFGAVLYMGERHEPDAADLKRIDELLSHDGTLVMEVASGSGGNGSGNGLDEGSLDELAGWAVAERIVVARRTNSSA